MVGPKKQVFWPKINILKGSHCILRIRGAPVHQKLGMILENKVVQKLELEKNNFLKQSYNELWFVKKCRNRTFKVNFLCQKSTEFFQKKIIYKYQFRRECFKWSIPSESQLHTASMPKIDGIFSKKNHIRVSI